MSQSILLRGARQLLTLRGPSGVRRGTALQDLAIIEDGSVLIRDGVILALGTSRRMENLKAAKDALEVSASGCIVMPAFVDPNFTLSPQPEKKTGESAPKRRRVCDFHDESLGLMRSCLQHGTLAVDVKASADTTNFHADIAVMRQLAKIASSPIALTRTWRLNHCPRFDGDADCGSLQDFKKTFSSLVRRKFIDAVEITAGDEPFDTGALDAAREASLALKLVWRGTDSAVLARLITRWLPRTVACSCTMSAAQVAGETNSPTTVVFSPGAELGLPSGTAIRQAIDAGAGVALSSGHHPQSARGFSMQIAVSLAIINAGLTPEEAISAATVNAAYAAGFGESVGTLEAGKRADILVLTVPDYREISRRFGINHVGMVIRDGALVYNRMRWKAGA